MLKDSVDGEPTAVQGALIDAHSAMLRQVEPNSRAYNHAVLCQTSLPYRTKKGQRAWVRKQGRVALHLQAGYASSRPGSVDLEPVELPAGPRARLVLIHIMSEAVLNQSPLVQLDDSLTAFARKLGLSTKGANIKSLREQLRRLSACSVRLVMPERIDGELSTRVVQGHFVEDLQVFTPSEPGQRCFWPSYLTLGGRFFESLLSHAVPLDPRALASLKHSSSALDTYQWLSQRLYKIPTGRQVLIPWKALHAQLGGNTRHLGAWKQDFLGTHKRRTKSEGLHGTLPKVLYVYRAAAEAVQITPKGLYLRQAEPPVPRWGHAQQRRYLGNS